MVEHRSFQLVRAVEGREYVVADGVQVFGGMATMWPDGQLLELASGWCRVVWRTEHASITLWRCVEDLLQVSEFDGATRLVWAAEAT